MKTYQANERLMGNLKLAMRDAEALLKGAGGTVSRTGNEIRNRLGNALQLAKTTYGRVQDQTAGAAKATDQVIHKHTYKTLGLALCAGLCIGALIARRTRSIWSA